MTLNRPDEFFAHVRTELFGGNMTQGQVDGIGAILAAWPDGTDVRWIAYALATAFHETARTMEPIEEYGKGHGRPYGVPSGPSGQVYYGRGLVQLTWLTNYARAEKEIPGSDLVARPERALEPRIAAEVMVRGMSEGWFTGKKLGDYLHGGTTDWINARRIINGVDCAAQIAGYAVHFAHAIGT